MSYEALQSFWSAVDIQRPRHCWMWLGAVDARGYGVPSAALQIVFGEPLAHRIVCRVAHGDADGRHVLHCCDTPGCCNPRHLRWGTAAENARDKDIAAWCESAVTARANGTDIPESWNYQPSTSRAYQVRRRGEPSVTAIQVAAMRAEFARGRAVRDISREFGVTQSHADSIVKRRIWKQVP